uniref:protein jag n=1 Tax=Helicobacter bizzozeronii TaxID=56877 RepID=UPI001F3DA24C
PPPKPTPLDDKNDKIAEIKEQLCTLLGYLPYQIDQVKVELCDSNTLYIELNGPDSALVIGEKGYRFNALSYLLFNWLHQKYGYNVRLEVAHFLKDQEEMMESYLQGIIMQIHEVGKAQTKPLDGMLIHIALKRLRETFPNKHITCQTNSSNERFVVINDFK